MNSQSPNKLIATKYCFLILGDDTSFFFSISIFFVVVVVILCYLFLQKFYYYYFFSWKLFYFFMFRDVPVCSRMFHVPGFIDGRKSVSQQNLFVKALFRNTLSFLNVWFCIQGGEHWWICVLIIMHCKLSDSLTRTLTIWKMILFW